MQPLLLVVSTRLAPHSEELVLGIEAFLTVRNKNQTTGRKNKTKQKQNTHRVKKSYQKQISWMMLLKKVTWIFCNYFLINTQHFWEARIWGRRTEIRGRHSIQNCMASLLKLMFLFVWFLRSLFKQLVDITKLFNLSLTLLAFGSKIPIMGYFPHFLEEKQIFWIELISCCLCPFLLIVIRHLLSWEESWAIPLAVQFVSCGDATPPQSLLSWTA